MFRRYFLAGCLMLVMLNFTGCQFFNKEPEGETTAETGEEEDPGITTEEEQLFNAGPKPVIDNYRPIAVTMPDGIKIKGTLYVPGLSPYNPEAEEEVDPEEELLAEEAAAGEEVKPVKPAAVQYPLIILLHMLSGDRWDWKEMPRHLVNAGYSVLAIDLRGHGESVYQGKRLQVWRQFDKNDWQKIPKDLKYLLKHIAKQAKFNMVDTQHVGVIGASIGANSAVNFASKNDKQVKAIILLSPGLEYHGVETFNPLTHYEGPVYFIVSKEDAYASDSTERLYKFALGKKKIQIYQDLGHGTDMLVNNPNLMKGMLDWLKVVLVPPKGAVPTEAATEEEKTAENGKVKVPAEKEEAAAGKKKAEDPDAKAKMVEKKPADKPKAETKEKPASKPAPPKPAIKPGEAPQPVIPTEKPVAPTPITPTTTSPSPAPTTPSPNTKPTAPSVAPSPTTTVKPAQPPPAPATTKPAAPVAPPPPPGPATPPTAPSGPVTQ